MIYNLAEKSATLNVNNTTGSINLFKVTGHISFFMWGEVTTAISSAHTNASWSIENAAQSARNAITSGTNNLSSLTAGTTLRVLSSGGAMQIGDITVQSVNDPSGSNVRESAKCICVPQNTDTFFYIVHRYTTTNAPSSGVIQYTMLWYPLDTTATVVVQ